MKDIFATDDPYEPGSAGAVATDKMGDDWGDEEDMDPFEDPNYDMYVLKWACDDAETLDAVIDKLREQISFFEGRRAEGWQLEAPVGNGYMHMRRAEAG